MYISLVKEKEKLACEMLLMSVCAFVYHFNYSSRTNFATFSRLRA